MSDNPQSRRRTLLSHSFMPEDVPSSADGLEVWRAQAGQTLLIHTPHGADGVCEYCWAHWPCDAASWAALVLELLG